MKIFLLIEIWKQVRNIYKIGKNNQIIHEISS